MITSWKCSGILFDLDGILVDSIAVVERHWNLFAERHGLDPNHVLHVAHGNRTVDSVRILLPGSDAVKEASIVEQGEVDDIVGLIAKEGAADLITSLPSDRWAVVTSGTRRLATARLKAVGLPVPQSLVTADEVTRGKPDAEPYLKGASLLGFGPAECVVIEDAPTGVRAGKSAGCRVIAISGTFSRKELAAADLVLSSLVEIDVQVASSGELKISI